MAALGRPLSPALIIDEVIDLNYNVINAFFTEHPDLINTLILPKMTILDFINRIHGINKMNSKVIKIVDFLKENGALTFEQLPPPFEPPPIEEPSPPPSPLNSMPPTPQPNGRTIKTHGIAGVGSRRATVVNLSRMGGRRHISRRTRRTRRSRR